MRCNWLEDYSDQKLSELQHSYPTSDGGISHGIVFFRFSVPLIVFSFRSLSLLPVRRVLMSMLMCWLTRSKHIALLLLENILVYICPGSVHSKQYWFFRRNPSVLIPCNPRRTLAGFSWGCMVIVLKGSF